MNFLKRIVLLLVGVFSFAEMNYARENNRPPTIEDYAKYFSKFDSSATADEKKKAEVLRVKTIQAISKILKSRRSLGEREFELYLRLGEINTERHDYYRDLEYSKYQNQYKNWVKSKKNGAEPFLNHEYSKSLLTAAVNVFRKLVSRFPKHPRADGALFALGTTLARLNNSNADLYFNQLLRTHPSSPLVPDTHLALGEHYFENQNIEKAIQNYRGVLKHPQHKAYPYAVYKLGWAHYNQAFSNEDKKIDHFRKAASAFKLVVKLSDSIRENAQYSLKDEALNDLVMVWADAEDVQTAWTYFQGMDETDKFYAMLERLGYIYEERGEAVKAIKVFARLLKEAPQRKTNYEVYLTVAALHEGMSQPKLVVRDLKNITKLYLGKTVWTQKVLEEDKEVVETANEDIRKSLQQYATSFHQYGAENDKKPYVAAAASLYHLYLKHYVSTKEAIEMRFYLATILEDFEKFELSSDQYAKVATFNSQYKSDSALSAISTLNQAILKTQFKDLGPRGKLKNAVEIPRVKSKLIKAIVAFSTYYPQDAQLPKLKMTVAETYFLHGHYPMYFHQ